MAAKGAHAITADFEQELCKYTGAPYAVALDNMSNALFLALYYELNVLNKYDKNLHISLPERTYPSVPCEVIHAGAKVIWEPVSGPLISGPYQLKPTKVWDSALRFTYNMYQPDTHMCLSFTGPYKHLKLTKGGAILTDDYEAYKWFKRARFSGRNECSYHDDYFDMLGWNFYMVPELAARGIQMMAQFYDAQGNPKHNADLALPYPNLSQFPIYKQ